MEKYISLHYILVSKKSALIKDNVPTCLSLYKHQRVLCGGSLQQLLCQTTPTGLQQPEDIHTSK